MNVVFDIGNVLVVWDPRAAFRHALSTDSAIDAFLGRVDFFGWNALQDAGRSRTDAMAAMMADHPDAAELVEGYFDHFALTIAEKIPGSWAILSDLSKQGHRLFGLTNWSADLWPVATQMYPELSDVFEDIVISGFERVMKPQREIYDILCARNGLASETCLFVDDSPRNVAGAKEAGWQSCQFTGAEALRAELIRRGVL